MVRTPPTRDVAAEAANLRSNRSGADPHLPSAPPGPGVYTSANGPEPHRPGALYEVPPSTDSRPSPATARPANYHSLGSKGSASQRPGVLPRPGLYTSTTLPVAGPPPIT